MPSSRRGSKRRAEPWRREYPNLGRRLRALANRVSVIFFACVPDPRWQQKFCPRIVQEPLLRTLSTPGIPLFDRQGAFTAEFSHPLGSLPFKTFFRFLTHPGSRCENSCKALHLVKHNSLDKCP